MKTLACRDMGVDCDFVAQGETEKEVMDKAMEHVKAVHPEKAEEMKAMSQQETESAMMAKMKDA